MTEIANRNDDRPARLGGDKPNPLRQLPAEWRKPVGFLFACFSDVLKAPVGIVSVVRMWIKEHGLTLSMAEGIFRKLLQPEEVGKVQYAGQLLARLGQLVAAALDDRRKREALAMDRARFARAERHAAPAALVGDALKGVLGRWRGEQGSPPPKAGEP